MPAPVKDILVRLAGTAHRGGAFSSDVLIAISEVLPEGPIVTIETGCGKSTIMFSNLSARHFVFAYDDRDSPDSSVAMVCSDPEFISENTVFVFGPTQRTLPVYNFPDGLQFDVILIDGPHGYPFPDLEYAVLYDKLKPGGILILDDVHIASIGNMYNVLREDRMYDDIGVFSTTALLRRTALQAVPPDGDHWYEQNFNVSRFPLSMSKYKPDRNIAFGEWIEFVNEAVVSKYTIKGIEFVGQVAAAQTIDLASSLEVSLPLGAESQVRLQVTYRSTYQDASEAATIDIGDQSWPLDYQKSWHTLDLLVNRPSSGQLRIMFMHPNAEAEHYRGTKRYEFRRPGVLIRAIRLDDGSTQSIQGSPSFLNLLSPSLSRLTRRFKNIFKP